MENEWEKIETNNLDILKSLKKIVSNEMYKEILDFLENSGEYNIIKIKTYKDESKIKAHKQQEDSFLFKYIFINQRTGYLEDDYYGEIWVPLGNKKYLNFTYSC